MVLPWPHRVGSPCIEIAIVAKCGVSLGRNGTRVFWDLLQIAPGSPIEGPHLLASVCSFFTHFNEFVVFFRIESLEKKIRQRGINGEGDQ